MHTCPKGQEQVEECGSSNLIGTKCNYSCERANGFICEMAQPHYRISQRRTYPREGVLLLLYQSTIKSATISIHFITISKCASSPPTTSTLSPILEFRKHCVGVSLQSLNWDDIQFIIHSFPLQYTYKKYQQQPF